MSQLTSQNPMAAAAEALDFLPADHHGRARRRRVDRVLLAAALACACGMFFCADTVAHVRAAALEAVSERVRRELLPEATEPAWTRAAGEFCHVVRCRQPIGVRLDAVAVDTDTAGALLVRGSSSTAGLVYQYVDQLRGSDRLLQVDLRRLEEGEDDPASGFSIAFQLALRPAVDGAPAGELVRLLKETPAARCSRDGCALASTATP